jgi:hypothetical protein
MSTVEAPRHALGQPQGSVRALLSLMIVFLVCALMLIPPREADKPTPIPAYLIYLMFLVLGHYFAARGHAHTHGQSHVWHQQPLHLPRGSVRVLILVSLMGTCIYRYVTAQAAFESQWLLSVQSLQLYPMLPVIVLIGFFSGALLRMVIGRQPPALWQDLEAWLSLMSVLLMGVGTMIHLIIDPSLSEPLSLPFWEGMLSAVVAFYFGERS